MLCARPKRERERDKKAFYPPADSFLRVCKPTEGQGWVHLACAVFVPELTFSDAKRLRIVEGISSIPNHRWSTVCNSSIFVEIADANSQLTAMYVVQPSRWRGHTLQRLSSRVPYFVCMVPRVQVRL